MRKRSKDQEEGNHPQKQELDPSSEAICGLNTWVPPGLHAMEPGPEGLRGWMNRPFNHPVEGKGSISGGRICRREIQSSTIR